MGSYKPERTLECGVVEIPSPLYPTGPEGPHPLPDYYFKSKSLFLLRRRGKRPTLVRDPGPMSRQVSPDAFFLTHETRTLGAGRSL